MIVVSEDLNGEKEWNCKLLESTILIKSFLSTAQQFNQLLSLVFFYQIYLRTYMVGLAENGQFAIAINIGLVFFVSLFICGVEVQ